MRSTFPIGRMTRHVLLFLTSVATGAAFYRILDTERTMWWISMASAYASLVLLAATLAIGPLNKLRARPNPLSGYLRRDLGIWAAILAIVHTVAGLQVHAGGDMLRYFIPAADAASRLPLRTDLFGLANHAGLAAGLVMVMLLCLSNDASLRRLGAARWKSLQRWNYAGAILVVLHGVAYQVMEKRTAGFILAYAAIILFAVCLQAAGWRTVKQRAP